MEQRNYADAKRSIEGKGQEVEIDARWFEHIESWGQGCIIEDLSVPLLNQTLLGFLLVARSSSRRV
jgi:hypothetical protein